MLPIFLGYPTPEAKDWIKKNYKKVEDPLKTPLTFTAEEPDSFVSMSRNDDSAPKVYLEYSRTGEENDWTNFPIGTNGYSPIELKNIGDKIYVRAKKDTPNKNFAIQYYGYHYNYFVMGGKISASGNINMLLDSTKQIDIIEQPCCFSYLFYRCTALINSPLLPATTLSKDCYSNMFRSCWSLTQVPELPASILTENCYSGMFYDCRSLTQPPKLISKTLAPYCYASMFSHCSALTDMPELPAENLSDYCYLSMFENCITLINVSEIGAINTALYSCNYMFSGCTSLTNAPHLKATTLSNYCYARMFTGCKNLSNINVDFESWGNSNFIYTNNWLTDVSQTGTFTCPNTLPEVRGTANIPNNWTIVRK